MPPIEYYVRRGVVFEDSDRPVEGPLKAEGAVELGKRIGVIFNATDEVRVRRNEEGRYIVIHKNTGRFVPLEAEDYSKGDFFLYLRNVPKEGNEESK